MKKSKKILSVVLASLMLATVPATGSEVFDKLPSLAVTANAEDVTVIEEGFCGENAKYVLTEDGTLTISPFDPSVEYASVDERHFARRMEIKNIIIEEGIVEVEKAAFDQCMNVESLSLPDTLVTLEKGNLDGLDLLKRLYIPASLVNLSIVDDHYESNRWYFLEEITVDPENPVYDSRENSNALFETATNTLIRGCKNTVIPSSTEHIGDKAFIWCDELESVSLPEGLKSIGENAFLFCSSLKEIIMPSSLTQLGGQAFMFCTSLKNVVLSDKIEAIPVGAFGLCASLEKIEIPEGIKSIGDSAFMLCNLTEITLPETLESICEEAFEYSNAEKLICKSRTVDISLSGFGLSEVPSEYAREYNRLWCDNYKLYGELLPAAEREVLLTGKVFDYITGNIIMENEEYKRIVTELKELEEYVDGEEYAIPGTLIVGYQGSSAQDYAEAKGIDFTSCPLGEHTNIQYNEGTYPATCTEKGFIGGSACLDCNTVIEMPEIIPAKGHKLVTDAAVPATCTVSGLTEGQHCSVCGYEAVPQNIIMPTGHTDNDGNGTCDVCGEEIGEFDEIQITFVERVRRFFSNLINAIIALFKKLFG